MKRLLIEKIFIYILGFLFCLFTSLNQGTSSLNVEQQYLSNISSIMKTYNYVKTEDIAGDLNYIQNDNSIILQYKAYPEKVKLKKIYAEFNLINEDNLNNIYSLLGELYDEDISIYNNEIQKMKSNYTITGEEQMWQDLNNNRQLMIDAGFIEIFDCGQATYIWKQF